MIGSSIGKTQQQVSKKRNEAVKNNVSKRGAVSGSAGVANAVNLKGS